MTKKIEIAYFVSLTLEIVFSLLGEDFKIYAGIFKVMLMPLLILNILYESNFFQNKFLITALIFAWLGDIFLIFPGQTNFIYGLGSFLVMQLFYIFLFWKNLAHFKINNPMNFLMTILTSVYVIGMVKYLSPHLDKGLYLPVLVYSICLGLTFLLAGWNFFTNLSKQNKFLFLGAFLFLFSDSCLAINIFVQELSFSSLFIMGTYGFAQLFLSKGLTEKIVF